MAVDLSIQVLIVDDYQTMLRIIRGILKQLGFVNIDEAMSGGEALRKLRAKDYGIVFSDWNMPTMTGFELLQEVRADSELKSLPFILVTSESSPDNVIAAKKAGVNNYVIKPFNADTLKKKIAAVLGPF